MSIKKPIDIQKFLDKLALKYNSKRQSEEPANPARSYYLAVLRPLPPKWLEQEYRIGMKDADIRAMEDGVYDVEDRYQQILISMAE